MRHHPYDATHLGHANTYLAFDLVNRVWRDLGHRVHYVQNATDVDDPLLERARETGEDWRELADREIELFRGDMTALRILPPDQYVGAVEAIPLIVEMIEKLRGRDAAYEVAGDVYFPVASDPSFGQVSGLTREEMAPLSAERGGDPTAPQARPSTRCCGWRAAPASRAGSRRSARAAPAGTWSARRSPSSTSGWRSTSRAAARTWRSRTTRWAPPTPRSPRGAAPRPRLRPRRNGRPGRREDVEVARQPGVRVEAAGGGTDPMAIRLALLAHHYRADWEWTPGPWTRRPRGCAAGATPWPARPARPPKAWPRRCAGTWPTT